MPVCLKCGKEVEAGKNFCEDCRSTGPAEVRSLMDSSMTGRYKPRRSSKMFWIGAFITFLLLVSLGVGYALLSMMPSNAKAQVKVRARVCHNNLERIQEAIDRYYEKSRQYPPAGKLNSKHPLVTDKYLEGVPHCPTTKRVYVIKQKPDHNGVTVECDSGLNGHSL